MGKLLEVEDREQVIERWAKEILELPPPQSVEEMNYPPKAYQKWMNKELAAKLAEFPEDYRIIMVPDDFLYPSPWCEDFMVNVNHELKLIALAGDFT